MGRSSSDARIRTGSPQDGAALVDGPLSTHVGPNGRDAAGFAQGAAPLRHRVARVAPAATLMALLAGLGALTGPSAALARSQPTSLGAVAPPGPEPSLAAPGFAAPGFAAPALAAQEGRSAGVQPRSQARSAGSADRRPATAPGAGDQRTGARGRAADRPTLENPFGAPPETTRLVWFKTADADGTGWISFREARGAIGFDAARFRVFDTDNDGRFTFEEYTEFLRGEALAGRELVEPRRPSLTREAPPRDAEQLRQAYDVDLDGRISRLELDRILLDYRSNRPSDDSATVMGHLDASGDNFLDLVELERLANYLLPASLDTFSGALTRPDPRTVDDLFGAAVERGPASPPRIEGPVPLFRRLDLDGDGYIEVQDLQDLEGRALTRVNLASILNTLDLDFDGRLSEGEFLHSMRSRFGR